MEFPIQCSACAPQPAHDRAHRDLKRVRGVLVTQALDRDQQHHHTLILGQCQEVRSNAREVGPRLGDAAPVVARQRPRFVDFDLGAARFAPSVRVDVNVSSDAEHPVIEAGAGREPVCIGKRTRDRLLAKVVAGVRASGKGEAKAAEARQKGDELGMDLLAGSVLVPNAHAGSLFPTPARFCKRFARRGITGLMERWRRMDRAKRRTTALIFAAALCWTSPSAAHEPGGGGGRGSDQVDRATQAADRAAQDLAKVNADIARDQQRFLDEKAKIQADAAKDPVKAQEDLAKLEADKLKWDAQRSEEAAKIESDLAEEQTKISEDMTQDAQRSDDHSASSSMQDLAAAENPDRDGRGFPIRRDEVAALDFSDFALSAATRQGFRLIERIPLETLGQSMVRLAVPPGITEAEGVRRLHLLDPKAAVDFTHYYGMSPAGEMTEDDSSGVRLARKDGKLRVGMVDTGVFRHPFLQSSKLRTRTFGHGQSAGPPDHGTAVASILISEGAHDLVAADVFRSSGAGAPFTSADAIAAALDWLAEERVRVVNVSLAGPRNAILDTMVVRAMQRGMTIVASAGNGGPTAPPTYPAALRNVVAVTAVDQLNHVYRYANQGSYILVAAPGVREPGAAAAGGFRLFSGTSFAAPHISAWLARCLATRKNAGLGPAAECRGRLIAAANDVGAPGPDPVYGYGVVR